MQVNVMLTMLILIQVSLVTHDILYYGCFGHVCGSTLIWVAVIFFQRVLTWTKKKWNVEAVCACVASIFFFFGREFRDLEKLGNMDWYGLMMPVACSIVLSMLFVLKTNNKEEKDRIADLDNVPQM